MNFDLPEKKTLKFLIVDDNRQSREMLKLYLREMSSDFCECEDGIDALAYYKKFLPDWVLMDWQMKRMDGLTATRQIVGNFPEAKILLVTQYNDRELREAASEAGAHGFILKENLSELREIFTDQN